MKKYFPPLYVLILVLLCGLSCLRAAEPAAEIIQSEQRHPIVPGVEELPVNEEFGDYFGARAADTNSVTVQFGVQHPSPDGMTVRLLKGDESLASITVPGRFARVRFTGLEPSTDYRVEASDGANFKAESVPCRTTDVPKGKPILKLAIVSDTHVSRIRELNRRLHVVSAEILTDVCADANRRGCSVMIHAGDITNEGYDEEYKTAKEVLSSFSGTLLTAPGNHDNYKGAVAKRWADYFGATAGYREIDGIQFVWLHTADGKLNKPCNAEAVEKLDTNRPAIIFSHFQLVPDDFLNDKMKVISDAEASKSILDKIAACNAVIYIGHKNVATTARLGNVLQINMPQTTQFPMGWVEADVCPEGIYQRFISSACAELEELSRVQGGNNAGSIGYRDKYSFEIWNSFVPWPKPIEQAGFDPSKVAIPEWAENEIHKTLDRFTAWRGEDETVVIPLISDEHSGVGSIADPINWADSKSHILLIRRAAELFGADAIADLGDIGFDRFPNWKPSDLKTAEARLKSQQELYRNPPAPVFFCMGNHDSGRAYGGYFSEKKLSAKEYGEMFNGMTRESGTAFTASPNLDYGYYDVPGKSCRLLFLNTSDGGENGYTDDQMNFLKEALETAGGKTVLIVQHVCLHPTIGNWYGGFPGGLFNNQRTCIRMLMGFVAHERGKSGNIEWDFSGTAKTSLAGVVSGDSHFDAQARQFGVNYAVTQSYGTVDPKNVPEEACHTNFSRGSEMLCDVIAVKPAKGEMVLFRIGAGGAERDRTFRF